MEKQFTPPETAVFSNVTWGKQGGGQKWGCGVEWSHRTITILHPDDWFKGGKSEKRKAGKGGAVDRWRMEGPRPWLPCVMDGACLQRGKKAFDSGTADE